MTHARIKRGTTFRAQIEMTADEWAALWPWDAVIASVRQQRDHHVLTVAADPDSHVITLRADTSAWTTGTATFNVRIRRGADVIATPAASNFRLQIFKGGGDPAMRIVIFGSSETVSVQTVPVLLPGRGADGRGIAAIDYDPDTGTLTITMTDGATFRTGDLRSTGLALSSRQW